MVSDLPLPLAIKQGLCHTPLRDFVANDLVLPMEHRGVVPPGGRLKSVFEDNQDWGQSLLV